MVFGEKIIDNTRDFLGCYEYLRALHEKKQRKKIHQATAQALANYLSIIQSLGQYNEKQAKNLTTKYHNIQNKKLS